MVVIIKRAIIFFLIFIIILSISLWNLTNKWIADGQKPAATGVNEYAIILGAKVNGENPSLSLLYRLEAALAYANDHPHVKLILSGGQGPGELITEAEAMKRFFLDNGIEADRLLLEQESTSTYENILFSKEMLPQSIDTLTVITSDYHLARARKLAETLGLQTDAVSAKTPQVVKLKLTTRERAALLKTAVFGK